MRYDVYNPLLTRIDELLQGRTPVYVAIDGQAAAGKSTLAAYLQQRYNANVIPMDHFFLRPEQRTPARLAEAGGNVDYERFKAEVQTPLLTGEAVAYRPFNCKTGSYDDRVNRTPCKLNIIEGAYSLHPTLADMYHIKVFLAVTPGEQLHRIEARNGAILRERFAREWIPMENSYFESCGIAEQCDFIFGGCEDVQN